MDTQISQTKKRKEREACARRTLHQKERAPQHDTNVENGQQHEHDLPQESQQLP